MKKFFFILFAVMFCANGFAQHIGLSVGYAGIGEGWVTDYEGEIQGITINLKYQYGISNRFRIEPNITYISGSDMDYYSGDIRKSLYPTLQYRYESLYNSYGNFIGTKTTSYDYDTDYELKSALHIGANLHTMIATFFGRFTPYLITGVEFYNHSYEVSIINVVKEEQYDYSYSSGLNDYTDVTNFPDKTESHTESGLAARLGLGIDCRIAYDYTLQAEFGWNSKTCIFTSIGLTYNF